MRTKKEKLKRFCEKCGAELIYIRLFGGRMATCEWKGPVPYWASEDGDNLVVTGERLVVRCFLYGAPEEVTGTGYVVHECEGERK